MIQLPPPTQSTAVPFVVTVSATETKAKSVDPYLRDPEKKGWVVADANGIKLRIDADLIEDDGIRTTRGIVDDLLAGRDPGGAVKGLAKPDIERWIKVLKAGPLGRTNQTIGRVDAFTTHTRIALRFDDGSFQDISVGSNDGRDPSEVGDATKDLSDFPLPEPMSFHYRFSLGFPRSVIKRCQEAAMEEVTRRRGVFVDAMEKRLSDHFRNVLGLRMASPTRGYPTEGMAFEDLDPSLRERMPTSLLGKKIVSARPVLIIGMRTADKGYGFDALKFLR